MACVSGGGRLGFAGVGVADRSGITAVGGRILRLDFKIRICLEGCEELAPASFSIAIMVVSILGGGDAGVMGAPALEINIIRGVVRSRSRKYRLVARVECDSHIVYLNQLDRPAFDSV